MATAAVSYNPAVTGGAPIAGSGIGTIADSAAAGDSAGDNTIDVTAGGGVIVDGTGETAIVPLKVRNAKDLSGIELKETGGTANTGFFVYNNADTLQARMAVTRVSGGIIGPSTGVGDLVLTGVAGVVVRGDGAPIKLLAPDNTVGWSVGTTVGAITAGRVQLFKGTNVASAASMTLGIGNFFFITGTTNIDTIVATNWQGGAPLWLQFADILLLKHGAGNLKMTAGADVATTANDIVQLMYDGTNWWQSAPIVPHA